MSIRSHCGRSEARIGAPFSSNHRPHFDTETPVRVNWSRRISTNPLNVLTESPDSGYLRYLILARSCYSCRKCDGGEAETGLVYIPLNTFTVENPVEYRIPDCTVNEDIMPYLSVYFPRMHRRDIGGQFGGQFVPTFYGMNDRKVRLRRSVPL